ncbi:jg21806 [Pararge aegeria aegeria]|uniref:Jg21806 protein n=1 Tax=Pararge aegeria aegeria TaxID=348720 RepID=A0A8S4QI98_9NEOP|nr:jg21806 [Pararge aegeria aegeria]
MFLICQAASRDGSHLFNNFGRSKVLPPSRNLTPSAGRSENLASDQHLRLIAGDSVTRLPNVHAARGTGQGTRFDLKGSSVQQCAEGGFEGTTTLQRVRDVRGSAGS